mmetsp:Transcript_45282/g.88981  ORF Transcript_45282/g.88981 Transcript_45282/m.88981 type:complete len:205 (+) Transcript_45282:2170-2784(+)
MPLSPLEGKKKKQQQRQQQQRLRWQLKHHPERLNGDGTLPLAVAVWRFLDYPQQPSPAAEQSLEIPQKSLGRRMTRALSGTGRCPELRPSPAAGERKRLPRTRCGPLLLLCDWPPAQELSRKLPRSGSAGRLALLVRLSRLWQQASCLTAAAAATSPSCAPASAARLWPATLQLASCRGMCVEWPRSSQEKRKPSLPPGYDKFP